MYTVTTLAVGVMKANCYVVSDADGNAIIVDPGDDAEFISQTIIRMNLKPKMVVATHGHFDHNLAAFALKINFNIPYLISKKDEFLLKSMTKSAKHFLNVNPDPPPNPEAYLEEGRKIYLGKGFFKVKETPGHTPGSISLYSPEEAICFVGDLLFKGGSIGRYDFSYANKKNLFESIERVMKLPEDVIIYSGHGEPTTVGDEKKLLVAADIINGR